ncbi:hypothetical protein NB640_11885 [Oxalobacter vibrioformis]|uniref:Portal protein n=1 Tax=Oxalobacter vibrioformis TaxID=933080 RepID=A0A9E9LZ42_9BURK|nr:hypothetical protein [Oxalobacter vibrioformis]WAW09903.1 hypothetical protein NB640_11885 [Oxalobacter vibrioformis]
MKKTFKDQPESNPLAKKWGERVTNARRHWDRFHRRIQHNRQVVSGFDWTRDPTNSDFYLHRANLIHSSIASILPGIYARNPEISVVPQHAGRELKLLCKTIESVTNRQLADARLKQRAKSTVRAALTCSFGVLKVMYQREMGKDPIIGARIQDAQDNLARVQQLMMEINDDGGRGEQERLEAELKESLSALREKAEVVKAEGIVIDRVLTEHLLIDPTIAEFWDYEQADWMIQIVPMKKSLAEGLYGYKLDKATTYHTSFEKSDSGRLFSGTTSVSDDAQICILEIWDKKTQRVYTMAEGCDYWLREPYSPANSGARWYPFFLLPFQTVDGQFIGPSMVDLTERLQEEHNETRNRYNEHRELIKPGYIAGADISERTLRRFSDAALGEITLIDSEGLPLQQAIMPKTHPPIDPMVYDTSPVRADWEQVTGLQDAVRASITIPKTATEASIMQQSLSSRIAEFRDQVEDFLQQIAEYTAQILVQELSAEQVERVMGPHRTGPLQGVTDPMTGQPVIGVIEHSYDWPSLSREEIFQYVELQIRAGSTGAPDNLDRQDTWLRMLPVIQPLIQQIIQFQMQGIDAASLIALLKESIARFDEKIDVDSLVPDIKPPQANPMENPSGGAAAGMPGAEMLQQMMGGAGGEQTGQQGDTGQLSAGYEDMPPEVSQAISEVVPPEAGGMPSAQAGQEAAGRNLMAKGMAELTGAGMSQGDIESLMGQLLQNPQLLSQIMGQLPGGPGTA